MVAVNHTPVKPEKLAATAVALTERELVVPTLFAKKGIEDFKGAKDDTLNVKVPGILPAHDYEWRNNRAQELILDPYKERKIAVRFGGNAYSATSLTDEEWEFDFNGWGTSILPAQAHAVARKLEYGAVKALKTGKYTVEIGAREDNVLKDIIEARRALNLLGASKVSRTLVVGSDWDTLLQSADFVKAASVGDKLAETAFADAVLGKVKGFNIVVSEDLPADEAYALAGDAFIFLNAAPHVPESVKGATSISDSGIAMRWMRDYDAMHLQERSIVNTWYGFQQVLDPVVYWDETAGVEKISDDQYSLRAVKLKLGGADKYFAEGTDKTVVGKALGLDKRSKHTVAALPA